MDLADRVVVVTGSARGLGREIVLELAAHGAAVCVHYNQSSGAADEVATLALEAGAVDAIAVGGDVTDQTAVDNLFSTVTAELGEIDILINNVGAFAPEHWRDMSLETWQQVIDTNLTGTYLCSKRALPMLEAGEYGRIVNIGYASSEKGLVNPNNFPYFVAKSGVIMFTRMLAADTQDTNMTVNAVSPYVIENSDEFPDLLPRGRPASFDDVLQPILFFLNPATSYVSGENIEVDGGWLPETV